MTAKRLLLTLLAVLVILSASVTAFADGGAETRPLFNYFQPDDFVTYDKATGVYGLESNAQNKLNRLSAVDYEYHTLKPEYSDDLIRFSYRFTESHMTVFDAADWCLYFSFRNAQGENPPWANSWAVYLMLKESEMSIMLLHNSNAENPAAETKVEYATVTNGAREFIDNEFHTIEISIDDETGKIIVCRDKGTSNMLSMSLDTTIDGEKLLMDKGGYSFSTNLCKAELKDLYFYNSKSTALDDEIAKYEALLGNTTPPTTQPTEPSTQPTEPSTQPTEPSTEPTEPSSEPSTEPTEPSEEPTDPSEEPTEPSGEPTEPSQEPTQAPTQAPTAPPADSGETDSGNVLLGVLIGALIGGVALVVILVVGLKIIAKKKQ